MDKQKIIQIGAIICLVMYLGLLFYLTFISGYYGRAEFHQGYNLIPFKTIIYYIKMNDSIKSVITNLIGNILAFMPLGFLVPIVSKRCRNVLAILLIAIILTAFIEATQYLTYVGTFDIDDMILNVVGGLFGYLVYQIIRPRIEAL